MEANDRERIYRVLESNRLIKKLYEEHVDLDSQVEALERRTYLTAREQLELKRLKRAKLQGVDRIMALVNEVQSDATQ
ncbi:MAG: YdcH family protein [Bdellovibrionota bacterium]|nr:MAG: YdcH family protein [Bdellovibrionota bacterium]